MDNLTVTTSERRLLPHEQPDPDSVHLVIHYECPQPGCDNKFEWKSQGVFDMWCTKCFYRQGIYQKLKFTVKPGRKKASK